MDTELLRFVQLGWIITHILLLLPLYLSRRTTPKKDLVKFGLVLVLFASFGLVVISLADGLRAMELAILLGVPAGVSVVYLAAEILGELKVRREQQIHMRASVTRNILAESMSMFTKQVDDKEENVLKSTVKPNRFCEFEFVVGMDSNDTSRVTSTTVPTGASLTTFRLLLILSFYSVIMPVATSSFRLPVPLTSMTVDAELSLVLVVITTLIFVNYIRQIHEQFHDEFVEVQEISKVNLVKKLAAAKAEVQPESSSDKSMVDTAKEKALSIKELKLKEEIKRKQEEMKNQINSILGNDEEEGKHFESEIYQKQLLIRKVQRILTSTPIGKEVGIGAIMKKLEETDEEKIENIIIGLIANNNVKGKYDIWDQKFLVGDASSRFIEQALENLRISPHEFEYIKISKSGDVEIKFDRNEELDQEGSLKEKKSKEIMK